MAVRRISRSFKDISLSFDAHPVTKDLTVIKNANAIKRSIRNIVQTIPGERFFNPILGSDVRSSLFDFVDFGTASVIQKEITTAIENFEPRVYCKTVLATAPAATLEAVSLADCLPPPLKSLIPYFLK